MAYSTIPGANLNDTLFVTIKKTRNVVKVPVNGYNYITITLENSTFNAKRSFEPDEALKEIMERERNKIVSSSVMNKRRDTENRMPGSLIAYYEG